MKKTATQTQEGYTIFDIYRILSEIIKLAKEQDEDNISEFTEKHPWSKKYLTIFPETDTMLRIANNKKHRIQRQILNETEIKMIKKGIIRPLIKFHIWAPPPDDRNSIVLSFESLGEGRFAYINI